MLTRSDSKNIDGNIAGFIDTNDRNQKLTIYSNRLNIIAKAKYYK